MRLIPKSVTLNELGQRSLMALILRYFIEFGSFRGALRKRVRVKKLLMSFLLLFGSKLGFSGIWFHFRARTVCAIFGRPFANGSPYAIGPLPVLSCLSVCNVGVLWPNGYGSR